MNQPTPAATPSTDATAAPNPRRSFLKQAVAAAGTAAAAGAAHPADPPVRAAAAAASSTPAAPASRSDKLIERPGSDFMLDVIRTLDLTYVATNPGSSFRILHESLVNYGGNAKPKLLTCLHEESAVAMAHGYAKAAGKPMGVMLHGTVGTSARRDGGLQRLGRPGAGHHVRRQQHRRQPAPPGTEWNHSVQDAAALVRDFVKWDDAPGSLQHFAESTVRAYKIAMTPPMEPVLVMADIDLQEDAIHDTALKIPQLSKSILPQGGPKPRAGGSKRRRRSSSPTAWRATSAGSTCW